MFSGEYFPGDQNIRQIEYSLPTWGGCLTGNRIYITVLVRAGKTGILQRRGSGRARRVDIIRLAATVDAFNPGLRAAPKAAEMPAAGCAARSRTEIAKRKRRNKNHTWSSAPAYRARITLVSASISSLVISDVWVAVAAVWGLIRVAVIPSSGECETDQDAIHD